MPSGVPGVGCSLMKADFLKETARHLPQNGQQAAHSTRGSAAHALMQDATHATAPQHRRPHLCTLNSSPLHDTDPRVSREMSLSSGSCCSPPCLRSRVPVRSPQPMCLYHCPLFWPSPSHSGEHRGQGFSTLTSHPVRQGASINAGG